MINPVQDMLKNHTDEEVIDYLAQTMSGVVRNCRVAVNNDKPSMAHGSLGDISMCTMILREMNNRNQARIANKS